MLSREHLERLRQEQAQDAERAAYLERARLESEYCQIGRNEEKARHIKLLEEPGQHFDRCYLLGGRPQHSSYMLTFRGQGESIFAERNFGHEPPYVIFEPRRVNRTFRLTGQPRHGADSHTVYWYEWDLVHQSGNIL